MTLLGTTWALVKNSKPIQYLIATISTITLFIAYTFKIKRDGYNEATQDITTQITNKQIKDTIRAAEVQANVDTEVSSFKSHSSNNWDDFLREPATGNTDKAPD